MDIISPLRYPGGKSKAIKNILPLIPFEFKEFREPFVGGGSVFLSAKQNILNNAGYIINDLNFDLYCFWKYAKEKNERMYDDIIKIKNSENNGRSLFERFTLKTEYSDYERAIRFFILNRITFSGTVDSGGYSQKAFEGRFTISSIERLKLLKSVLSDVEIKNSDYEEIIFHKGEGVFIFLDPPYLRQAKSRLYGKNGSLHVSFDHKRFAENMKKCQHKWLITLDDTEEIKDLFSFAYINEWELQYGMNNYKKEKAEKGKELFISNYKIELPKKYTDRDLFQDFNYQNAAI